MVNNLVEPAFDFEYDCMYEAASNKRRNARKDTQRQGTLPSAPLPSASPSRHDNESTLPLLHHETRTLEANPGATFLRRLALRLGPKSAPRLHCFAWNAFLGARKTGFFPTSSPVTSMLSQATVQHLSLVYLQKVDPIYGFVDHQKLERYVAGRWAGLNNDPMQDAIICGVAALGCLFSHVQPTKMEHGLVESARLILEHSISDIPTTTSITAWLLRVVYPRIADSQHTAWTASCILMHMIEAAGLHRGPSNESPLSSPEDADVDLRRRFTTVSQHLNIWTSFDMGRSRIALCDGSVTMPSSRPGDYTAELMELLPYSAELDPQKSPSVDELETALLAVMNRVHSVPPSVLAQCNFALCLCRRLQSICPSCLGKVLEQVLALCSKEIQAAPANLDERAPWHHLANIPFQVICLLLAIDHHSCTPCLKDAMSCLSNAVQVYSTGAIQEAFKTASSLISLHIRWKERCTTALRDILITLPDTQQEDSESGQALDTSNDCQWLTGLTELSEDLSSLPCFDIGKFIVPTFLRDEINGGRGITPIE